MSLASPNDYTFDVDVSVMGVPLSDQVMDLLLSLTVDDDGEQADIFELRFRDTARTVLALGRFVLGAPVTIKMTTAGSPMPVTLMEGEITTIEAEYDTEVGTTTVVRGFDKSHKLFRGRTSKNYQMMKASDVASMIAASNGLIPDVDATTTVYTQISQANESDWQFLKRLARQSGRTLTVAGPKLKFKRPGGPVAGLPITLKAGEQLLGIRIALSTNEQVKKVVAQSYDPLLQQAVVGQAPLVTTMSRPGSPLVAAQGQARVTQEYLASEQPYANAGDAQAAAMALSAQIAEGYVELHGETFGNPRLRAGSKVQIQGMGMPFNGSYNVTSTRHVFNGSSMYTTEFAVTGSRDDSIIGLTAAAPVAEKMHGIMVGVVTDNNDPQKLGRVKVKIPALGATFQTGWASVIYPGAGGAAGVGRGLQLVPEVGDHVVIAFEQGDVNYPYVLGGFYTNMQKPGHGQYVGAGKVTGRKLSGQNGDHILLNQATGNEQIVISSADGKIKITLGTGTTTNKHVVQIETDFDVVVKAAHDVSVSADNNVSVEAKGKLAVKAAGQMSLESQAALNLKGATVKIEGSGPVEVKGAVIKLN